MTIQTRLDATPPGWPSFVLSDVPRTCLQVDRHLTRPCSANQNERRCDPTPKGSPKVAETPYPLAFARVLRCAEIAGATAPLRTQSAASRCAARYIRRYAEVRIGLRQCRRACCDRGGPSAALGAIRSAFEPRTPAQPDCCAGTFPGRCVRCAQCPTPCASRLNSFARPLCDVPDYGRFGWLDGQQSLPRPISAVGLVPTRECGSESFE
jgi:hypothetical protein